jgi:hypothetical protein
MQIAHSTNGDTVTFRRSSTPASKVRESILPKVRETLTIPRRS